MSLASFWKYGSEIRNNVARLKMTCSSKIISHIRLISYLKKVILKSVEVEKKNVIKKPQGYSWVFHISEPSRLPGIKKNSVVETTSDTNV